MWIIEKISEEVVKEKQQLPPEQLVEQLSAQLAALQAEEISIKVQVMVDEAMRTAQSLKLALTSKPERSDLTEQTSLQLAKSPTTKPKILVVDDDEDIQRLLHFALSKKGFEVVTETYPKNALATFNEVKPDLLLLDIMMPLMTGFEFLERLKTLKIEHPVKIIVGSSRSFDKDRLTVLQAGANEFVAKPYNLNELVLRMQRLLGSKS